MLFCGVRNATISGGGTVIPAGVNAAICQSTNPAVLTATLAARCLNPGTPYGQPRLFRFNGCGPADPGRPLPRFPAVPDRHRGNIIACPIQDACGGATLRDTGQIAPGLERYHRQFAVPLRHLAGVPSVRRRQVRPHPSRVQEGAAELLPGAALLGALTPATTRSDAQNARVSCRRSAVAPTRPPAPSR